MYESRHQAPLSRAKFAQRLLGHSLVALGLLAGSLAFGMLGYVVFEHLSWIDAFLNSSMLLGGMGPVDPPQTAAGKLFAGLYALYAGLAFIVAAALLFTPILHRLLHRFHWDEKVTMLSRSLVVSLISVILPAVALAGPPFRTDDPEPVEYEHWEFYVASQGSFSRDESMMTAPHVEVNYGVLPNVQIHLLAPFEYVNPKGEASHYGYSDTELGVKFRFIQETDWRPQAGVFPIVLLPTGDEDKNLGAGKVQAFFPLWLQKSWEPWKTYGGGGYWINPGSGNRDYWFFGWEMEREMSEYLTLGAEIFHQTASERGGDSDTGFNVGAIVNFSEIHHLLLSAGRDISGPNDFSYYIGCQLTFGP